MHCDYIIGWTTRVLRRLPRDHEHEHNPAHGQEVLHAADADAAATLEKHWGGLRDVQQGGP